jgi:N-acetylglutamate synthase-like GNAT family acetyltransferase
MGIGSRLLEACEKEARALGAAKVMLVAESRDLPWYERRGYTRTSARFLFKTMDEPMH